MAVKSSNDLFRKGVLAMALLCVSLASSGCKTTNLADLPLGPGYQPSNIYRGSEKLPEKLRRVAVLPIAVNLKETAVESGRESLQPVLFAELAKTRRFELVAVDGGQLRQWGWLENGSDLDKLPANFLKEIRDALGCDGVLFSRLNTYRAYPPLASGWNFKLVECQSARVIWSADEVFDAGNGQVANSARRYFTAQIQQPQTHEDSHSILNSPRRFSQYTLHTLFSTLPTR